MPSKNTKSQDSRGAAANITVYHEERKHSAIKIVYIELKHQVYTLFTPLKYKSYDGTLYPSHDHKDLK